MPSANSTPSPARQTSTASTDEPQARHANTSPTLGQRLRILRTRHGLSQRELAKRANVTNSTISQVEQDAVSPSVSSLNKILDVFPSRSVTSSATRSPRRLRECCAVRSMRHARKAPADTRLRKIPDWPDASGQRRQKPQVTLGRLEDHDSVSLQASHDSLLLVTRGRLRIELPAEALDIHLRSGDAVRLQAGERYRLHHAQAQDADGSESLDEESLTACHWSCIASAG
ncbi:helix-turn-helix domain-containing protein [Cobetia marina]